jgi:hypothetical protein
MRVEFWANHTGIKSDMLLGTIREQIGKLKKLMGTYRENDGNKGKKAKDSSPSFLKRKKMGPLMSPFQAFHWLHATFVSKSVYVTIFGLA